MKRGVLITVVIIALAMFLCPLLATAQQVAPGGKASYKGVADFYSKRFFPVGQAVNAAQQAAKAAAQATDDKEDTVEVGEAGTVDITENATNEETDVAIGSNMISTTSKGEVVRAEMDPDGGIQLFERTNYEETTNEAGNVTASFDWKLLDNGTTSGGTAIKGEAGADGKVVLFEQVDNNWVQLDRAENDGVNPNVDTVVDGFETVVDGTEGTVLEADTQEVAGAGYAATYDEAAGTISYEANGETKTVNIADIGLSADWLSQLNTLGGTLSVTENEDGSVKLITGSDDGGAKKWEYDPSARLVAHYEGEAGSEKCTVVTSDEVYDGNYIWASDNAADPGAGPDNHQVVQRFNYDDAGELSTVDYFTWTAGDRQGVDKARYMYRQDTVTGDATATEGDGTADDSVTAECPDQPTCDGKTVTTKYFNDPFPVDWDPVLTGTVTKDEYGNYWLETCDGNYLLTARNDGFDADQDGSSGADEMNSIDWESMVGKEITVRGHQVNPDSEGGVYKDGEKADIFEVVDVITPEEKESLGDNYQATLDNMEAVAAGADPVNEGLTGDGQLGELGFINMFNGEMPQEGDFADTTERLYSGFSNSGLASFYLNNIDADTLASIRQFATDALETALQAAEAAAQEGQDVAEDATNTTDDVPEAGTFDATYDAEAGTIGYNDAAGNAQSINIDDLGWSADDLETVDTLSVTVNDQGQTTVTATLEDGTTITATLPGADDTTDDAANDTTDDGNGGTPDNAGANVNQNLEPNADVDALLARQDDPEWWRTLTQ